MRKIKTGLEELDKMLNGGIIERSATILTGAPGTGKTTLGLQFIYNGAVKYNEPGLFVSFEQFPQILYRDALEFGWDLEKLEKEGKLKVIFSSPDVFKHQQELVEGIIEKEVRRLGARRIVLDNLSHFTGLVPPTTESTPPGTGQAPESTSLRQLYNSLVNSLKRESLTSLLLLETKGILRIPTILGDGGISFIADNIIILRYVEIESSMRKALAILKTRGSSHARGIREFSIGKSGIVVKSKFKEREGVLTGMPTKITARVEEFLGK